MKILIPRGVLLLLLAVLSVSFQAAEWRYREVAGEVLRNVDFGAGSNCWTVSENGQVTIVPVLGGAILRRDRSQERPPFILQTVPDFTKYEFLRVNAEIRLEDVRPGPKALDRAIVMLEALSAQGESLRYWPHLIAGRSGTAGWQSFSRILPVPHEAGSLRLQAFVGTQHGTMAVRGISVTAYAETRASVWLGRTLLLAWLLAGIWCLWPLLRRPLLTPSRVLVLAAATVLLVGAMTPQPLLGQTIGYLKQASGAILSTVHTSVRQVLPDLAGDADNALESGAATDAIVEAQKPTTSEAAASAASTEGRIAALEHLGHLVAHMIITGLALAAYGRRSLLPVVVGLFLLAVTSEAMQSFLITRDAEWSDLAYNCMGILFACLAALLFWSIPLRPRQRLRPR